MRGEACDFARVEAARGAVLGEGHCAEQRVHGRVVAEALAPVVAVGHVILGEVDLDVGASIEAHLDDAARGVREPEP
jgi:hypothetical protein